jgi:hypothetical protein
MYEVCERWSLNDYAMVGFALFCAAVALAVSLYDMAANRLSVRRVAAS